MVNQMTAECLARMKTSKGIFGFHVHRHGNQTTNNGDMGDNCSGFTTFRFI